METQTASPKTSKKTEKKKVVPTITQKSIEDFAIRGVRQENVKYIHQVKDIHLFDNTFRVNVWCCKPQADRLVDKMWIEASYFIELTSSGDIVDLTKGSK